MSPDEETLDVEFAVERLNGRFGCSTARGLATR
jgi:hypothetical protein